MLCNTSDSRQRCYCFPVSEQEYVEVDSRNINVALHALPGVHEIGLTVTLGLRHAIKKQLKIMFKKN